MDKMWHKFPPLSLPLSRAVLSAVQTRLLDCDSVTLAVMSKIHLSFSHFTFHSFPLNDLKYKH